MEQLEAMDKMPTITCHECWNHGTAIVQRQAQGYAVALRPGDVT
jgi:hypothetical protein